MKVGDYVCLASDESKSGTVISLADDQVTWRTARGAYFTNSASELVKKEGSYYSSYGPDAMELAANVAVFAGSQVIRKRRAFGEPTMRLRRMSSF